MKKVFAKNEINSIAKEILKSIGANDKATVIALSGDLGAGKTTLTQEIARELGVKENVISPTFILMKRYPIDFGSHKNLVHIDAYRFDSHSELERLGWAEIISDSKNLVLIEWPERVAEIMPANSHKIFLAHKGDEEREIEF